MERLGYIGRFFFLKKTKAVITRHFELSYIKWENISIYRKEKP
jgi:hypothetical protein